jgi:hypothetical protein
MSNRKGRTVLCLLAVVGLGLAAFVGPASASVTISPLSGTVTALPATQISFLGAASGTLRTVSVVGSSSGRHTGSLRPYSSTVGQSFVPRKPFTPGEHVAVHAIWAATGGRASLLSSFFTVARSATVAVTEFPTTPGTPADVQSFHSVPEMHPPAVTIHQAAGPGSAPGYVFAAPFIGPGQYGPMIFDNAGNLVWFRQVPPGQDAAGFRTQTFHGENDLTWWQGRTLQFGYGLGENVIANANYKTVAVVRAGNGLQSDEHEFLVTPQGSAFLLAYSPVHTNLSSAGGPGSGIALDGVIQQIDIHTGLVMWEWHSLGHVALTESYSKAPTASTAPYDYFHINSLTLDSHGNLLISARNTWALYDISVANGRVMWRLGGKRSTFALAPGVAFAYQHNALWLPGGQISVFDDEGAPTVKAPSRGEIVTLDSKHKTATLGSQLVRMPGPLITGSQGNLQSLPNGGWMVGWGGLPNLTEFNAQGQVIFDAQLPPAEFSYRVYREPWTGQPSTPPSVAARQAGGAVTVYASWNGATTVSSWQLLSGVSATQLAPVSTTPRTGFETTMTAPSAAFVQVRGLSASGKVLGTSAAVAPTAG